MFKTTVKAAVIVPGFNYLHITGVDSKGKVHIGDCITDGNISYEITSIPFVRRSIAKPEGEVDICIRPDNHNPDEFIGKTLYSVQ